MKDKNVIAIIQARMGSTRLPGKVLIDIAGKPMLWHVMERVKGCKKVDSIVVATTSREEDKAVIKLAKKCGVGSFAGSSDDVLDRYYQTARKFNAEVIVRITADCPLIDPHEIDKLILYFENNQCNHAGFGDTYPDGFNAEVFDFLTLKLAWENAKLKSDREHVTVYIWKNKDMFDVKEFRLDIPWDGIKFEKKNLNRLLLSVDTMGELDIIRKVYRILHSRKKFNFTIRDVLLLLTEKNEEIKLIYSKKGSLLGYYKSVEEEQR